MFCEHFFFYFINRRKWLYGRFWMEHGSLVNIFGGGERPISLNLAKTADFVKFLILGDVPTTHHLRAGKLSVGTATKNRVKIERKAIKRASLGGEVWSLAKLLYELKTFATDPRANPSFQLPEYLLQDYIVCSIKRNTPFLPGWYDNEETRAIVVEENGSHP